MAAGLATLNTLEREDGWVRLEALGAHLEHELNAVIENVNAKAALARVGSIFWLALGAETLPRSADAIANGAAEAYGGLFRSLLADGIALAPSAYEVGFLSLAHSIPDVDRLCAGIGKALAG
jgi:glutamate-1-semialdehyde 2,1-aminomutase